ncbi:hypothetical protein COOONC_08346, partial [Cooperia oncophora]
MIVSLKELRTKAPRAFSKHRRDKRLRDEDVERMRKERLAKRAMSRTPSPDETLLGGIKKRERSPLERIKKKDKQSENRKHDPPISSTTPEQITVTVAKMEMVESVEEGDATFLAESEITSFTLDSPAGPQKYSKFDMAEYSDVEVEPEPEFDPSTATYETLTDEQKALLSPDTKKRLENEWQKRLIAQLPIYYASFMGCRNVVEFDCVNRVEEGTFGVVYRAKNKRT